MTDIRKYIESGILELYCMGNLSAQEEEAVQQMMVYPEVQEEINNIQASMEAFAQKQAVAPPAFLQDTIGALINNLAKEKVMDRNDLPLINRFSDHLQWLSLLQHKVPTALRDGRYSKVLTHTPAVTQMFIVSETDFEDEVHTDEIESFLILQGTCDCFVGDRLYQMTEGDFMEIPLHEHHDVKITSPHVVAIMQRVAVA